MRVSCPVCCVAMVLLRKLPAGASFHCGSCDNEFEITLKTTAPMPWVDQAMSLVDDGERIEEE
jgi:hypothetical protein